MLSRTRYQSRFSRICVGGAAVVHDVGQITADFPQGGEQPVLHTLQYCKFILKIKVKSGAGYTAYLADAGNAYAVDTVPLVNFQKGGFNILNSALAVQRPAGGHIHQLPLIRNQRRFADLLQNRGYFA